MKMFNKKRLSISLMLFILVGLLLIFISMDIFTSSRYETAVTSQNSIRTAIYLLDDTYQTVNVRLPDVVPDNSQYKYSFSVSNYNEDDHADTNIKYRVHIRTTTNMEIEYDLFNTLDIDDAESYVSSDTVVQDYNGTHFRHIYTAYNTMLYSEDKTDYYTILFTFPDDFINSRYSGIAEMIEINIESTQILDSDT
jgi:hypothetical protein